MHIIIISHDKFRQKNVARILNLRDNPSTYIRYILHADIIIVIHADIIIVIHADIIIVIHADIIIVIHADIIIVIHADIIIVINTGSRFLLPYLYLAGIDEVPYLRIREVLILYSVVTEVTVHNNSTGCDGIWNT